MSELPNKNNDLLLIVGAIVIKTLCWPITIRSSLIEYLTYFIVPSNPFYIINITNLTKKTLQVYLLKFTSLTTLIWIQGDTMIFALVTACGYQDIQASVHSFHCNVRYIKYSKINVSHKICLTILRAINSRTGRQ